MNTSLPPPDTVILGPDQRFARSLEPAVRRAFPGAAIVSENGASRRTGGSGGSLAFILVSSQGEADAVQQELAAQNAPAPPVVALEWISSLPQQDGGGEAVAHVLQREWEVQALRMENRKLAGDLAMIGRRIGHDIRAQLGGIVSTADLMTDLFPEPEDPHSQMTKTVLRSVDEILVLLDRVKAIVMTAGPVPRDQEMMIGDVAMAEARKLEDKIRERAATLEMPGEWPPVHGVHPWLKVIWSNLFTNAIQHGGDGVHVKTGWSQNGGWRFWVRDDGPGVEENRRQTLFPTIHALHELHGQGSGLAIVRRLCEHMSGRCGYEAPPEGGACFWFSLPPSASMKTQL